MNRLIYGAMAVPLFIVLYVSCSSAQSVTNIKFGVFNPEDAKTGFIVGFTTGRQVDERLDFSLGADLFIRRFTQGSTVDTSETSPGGTTSTLVQTELSYSIYALPVMVHLDFHILPYAIFQPYIGVAGGYEILFSREANYITDDKKNQFYGGFGWQLMIGGAYPLGSASSLIGEVFYNGCTVRRSKGDSEFGFPIHEELDFSGLGLRVGLRF